MKKIYKTSLALFTDLYELTMAYGYWQSNMADRDALFHLTYRKWPFEGGYAIFAGLNTLIEYLEEFHFTKNDLDYLHTLKDSKGKPLFAKEFLHYLSTMQFSCNVDAPEEGSLIFPYEPLLRVEGPIIQAQVLESVVLNILNFQTLIATKSARICLAAQGDEVVEFGMRRAQGFDGALSAARAAFIGGCASSSNVMAGLLWDIPVKGTMAHSWVMAFDTEIKAFSSFADSMPNNCIFLIDTYDTIEGVKKAIEVAKQKQLSLLGVRLDSGDLLKLSKKVQKILDEENLPDVKIMASNELDEYLIEELKKKNSPISLWGVGTNLITAKDQPALDGVYKLTAIQNKESIWEDKIKLSEQLAKTTIPGRLQVRRYIEKEKYVADLLYDNRKDLPEKPTGFMKEKEKNFSYTRYQDLLQPIFHKGKKVYEAPTLKESQSKTKQELSMLSKEHKKLKKPTHYPIYLEKELHKTRKKLIEESKK